MQRYYFLVFLLGLLIVPISQSAMAQASMVMSIAAVVNEKAITESDIDDRMDMVIASSRLPNNREIRQKLMPQIVDSLIDEQLKLQEAERLEIEVSDEEVDAGVATIAKNNKIPPKEFPGRLKAAGVKVATIRDQVKAELAWNKVLQNSVRSRVSVTESDVDSYIEIARNNLGKDEFFVSEIFLPVDEASKDASVKQLANKLVAEIRKGAPFPRVAAQFSKAAGAQKGGAIGWIQQGQLPEELDQALVRMKKGELSAPIHSQSGYHILFINEQRTITEESIPGRDLVRNIIGQERMEKQARRFLFELRADAFIEKRLPS